MQFKYWENHSIILFKQLTKITYCGSLIKVFSHAVVFRAPYPWNITRKNNKSIFKEMLNFL